jgi:hypothetical protein
MALESVHEDLHGPTRDLWVHPFAHPVLARIADHYGTVDRIVDYCLRRIGDSRVDQKGLDARASGRPVDTRVFVETVLEDQVRQELARALVLVSPSRLALGVGRSPDVGGTGFAGQPFVEASSASRHVACRVGLAVRHCAKIHLVYRQLPSRSERGEHDETWSLWTRRRAAREEEPRHHLGKVQESVPEPYLHLGVVVVDLDRKEGDRPFDRPKVRDLGIREGSHRRSRQGVLPSTAMGGHQPVVGVQSAADRSAPAAASEVVA